MSMTGRECRRLTTRRSQRRTSNENTNGLRENSDNDRKDALHMSEWKPIYTAPRKTEGGILVYYQADNGIYHVVWNAEKYEWVSHDWEIQDFCQTDISHWMPLPEPPPESNT
jgi:hypothetical protein